MSAYERLDCVVKIRVGSHETSSLGSSSWHRYPEVYRGITPEEHEHLRRMGVSDTSDFGWERLVWREPGMTEEEFQQAMVDGWNDAVADGAEVVGPSFVD